MVNRAFSFVALALLSSVALLSAQPAPLSTQKNSNLTVPTSVLVNNGLPGLSGPPINLMVASVQSSSAQGGTVSLQGVQAWERRYNGPVSNEDQAFVVTVDKDGNIIVGGYSMGAGATLDFVTIKYTPDGVGLWTNRFDSPEHGTDEIEAIATDGSGGVYVSGESGSGITTIKYSSDGTPVWNNSYTNFSGDPLFFSGLAVDNDGNAYLLPVDVGANSFFTVKYDFNGNPAWTNVFKSSPTSTDTASAITVDATGNIFVAGYSTDSGSGSTFLTIKYASDGSQLWLNRYSLEASESASRVLVDSQGNVIVAGDSHGGTAQHKYVIVKYSNSGIQLWTNIIAAANYVGGGVPQLTTDPTGNVLLVGATPGASATTADYTALKFSDAGARLWTNRFVDPNSGTPSLVGAETDNAGNLYWSINSGSPSGSANYNYVTVKYATANGVGVWTNRYNSSFNASDLPRAMTVDKAGGVYVTGTSSIGGSSFGALDWATIKYADNLRYTPPLDYIGQDIITFTGVDSLGNSAVGTVIVNVLPGPVAAVAPVSNTSAFGNGGLNTLVRGTNNPRTYQMQFTPGALSGLPVGARITALGFRLATNSSPDFPSIATSWSDYQVTLAQAANSIANMSTNFQANLLNPVLVRSGPLSLAPGFFTSGRNPNPFATMLVFNTPYVYQGGDLMMQFVHPGSDSATATPLLDALNIAAPGYAASFRALSANTNITANGTANAAVTIVEIVFTAQTITHATNQFIITGSGGLPGEPYQLLTATNIALPVDQWTPLSTNQFGTNGIFNYTNNISPNGSGQYFRISTQ